MTSPDSVHTHTRLTEALPRYVADRLVSEQKHPDADLWIYNYTERVQYGRLWDDVTSQCRGLILDGDRQVVSRPFGKFFNLDEHLGHGLEVPAEPFHVWEKLDGSLGIVYWLDGEPHIATRGSFTSEQARYATRMLREQYDAESRVLTPGRTYLFEIIYPGNKIVVDYGADERLSLLSVIDTETGAEAERVEWPHHAQYHGLHVFEDGFIDNQQENREGYVLHWPERGLRVKVKFDEYKRLHRLVTGVNAKSIWEALRAGDSLNELCERVPDEFQRWVEDTAKRLRTDYSAIEGQAKAEFARRPDTDERKAIAVHFMQSDLRSILFAMLDGKDYSEAIWKMVRPEAERPFKVDIDA